MPIRAQDLLRGADGRPRPQPELLARLQKYDERVGLFYTNAAWAIIETWRPEDPRRARVQRGEMPEDMAFDICGYLPVTCSVDEAPAYIERELRSYTEHQFNALRHAVNHWNDVGMDQVLEEKVLGAVSDDLNKAGPSIGVFNVPGEVVAAPEPTPPPMPEIAAVMAPRRRRKKDPE